TFGDCDRHPCEESCGAFQHIKVPISNRIESAGVDAMAHDQAGKFTLSSATKLQNMRTQVGPARPARIFRLRQNRPAVLLLASMNSRHLAESRSDGGQSCEKTSLSEKNAASAISESQKHSAGDSF